jgi:hypothetical protein
VGSDILALLSQDARSSAEVSAFLVRMHCLRAGLESGCRPHRRAMGMRDLVGEQFDDLVGFIGRDGQSHCLIEIAHRRWIFLDPLQSPGKKSFEKIRAARIRHVAEIANKVCDRMLVARAAML